MMSAELRKKLVEGAATLGVELGDGEVELFDLYLRELKEWNSRFNLTSVRDDDGIVARHFLDSLTVFPYVKGGGSMLDIGAGAGFPGVPLRIVMGGLRLTLMDSVGKKTVFLEALVSSMGFGGVDSLGGVRVVRGRAEDKGVIKETLSVLGGPGGPGRTARYDIVVSRALTSLHRFFCYASPYLAPGGRAVAMKGPLSGRLAEELPAVKDLDLEIHEITPPFSDSYSFGPSSSCPSSTERQATIVVWTKGGA